MTTTETEAPEIPQPTFPHHAYGVNVTWLGDEGGMIARGHIPERRFIAACNHLARVECGLTNIWDEHTATLDEALAMVARDWAVPTAPADFGGDFEWAVSLAADEHTPGAIAVTTLLP